MAELAELIDRAVVLPPGPELSAVLSALSWEKVPNARLVEVLQARSRQLAHDHAELYAGMVEISHTVALDKLPGEVAGRRVEVVARAGERFEWASHEIAAGLTFTPGKADRELGFGIALCERLPLVFTALQQGRIDVAKARVFVDYLDPANGEITEAQARRLCERFVPVASGLTVNQLAARLWKALLAVDPGLRRRRYERAVQGRGVAVYLNPRTGTASLVGAGLPADEAAAAAARNDRMVDAAKRAGHPGTRGQIAADLYLAMLNGEFYGLTENEIIKRVLAKRRPEDNPQPDSGDDTGDDYSGDGGAGDGGTGDGGTGDGGEDGGVVGAGECAAVGIGVATVHGASGETVGEASGEVAEDTAAGSGDATVVAAAAGNAGRTGDTELGTEAGTGTGTEAGTGFGTESGAGADAESGAEIGTGSGTGSGVERGTGTEPDGAAVSPAGSAGAAGDRWAGERVATREGIEIRVGLGTVAGCDDRPGEIPGLGPVGAHVARTVAAGQRRGARWVFALVDPRGYLLLAGPLRRRPHTAGGGRSPGVRGGVVEVHLSLDELQRYAADPALADWHGVLEEISKAWEQRDELRKRLAANPSARFARGPLADHVCVRDRNCVGPGCMCPARRSDLDHTRDHGRGGPTTEDNIGPACRRHHPDKDRGWSLSQPEPGLFRWVSPLGRVYLSRGEPVRPDVPDPDPAPDGYEETAAEVDQRLRRYDPRMLERPGTEPPRPPPPRPEPPPDDEPPSF